MGGVSLVVRPLQLVGTIILARLLSPSDFGTVTLAMVLIGTSYMFVGLGMDAALVHSEMDRKKVAFQAFAISLFSGILSFLVLSINAEIISSILGDVDVAVFRGLLPIILFTTLTIVPEAMLSKELRFNRLSAAVIISEIMYMIVAIILAVMGYGLWSLVYGKIASALVRVILVWLFNPSWDWIKPKKWDWDIMRSLLRFGLQTTAGGIVSYFHTHWDDWFVGRQFGTTALGYYSKAYDLSNNVLSSFSRSVINGVFFPSYTKIQNEKERLTRVYLKSYYVVLLMMVPISLGMLVLAPELVPVLLGPKWIPMITTLQIFAFMVLVRPLSENTVPLFLAVGRPNYMVRAGLVLSVVMVPLVIGLSNWGIEGVAIAVVISHIAGVAYNLVLVERILPGIIRPTLSAFVKFAVMGLLMALCVQLVKPYVLQLVGGIPNVLSLVILVMVGVVVYCGLAFLTQKTLIYELVQLFLVGLKIENRFPKLAAKVAE
ncbi:MAG: lipopolysaccharide biosynthesis protein [Anaerolineales bacterium]|nr:lipopolysaccharide biosynthesis protein [Anaerolineales bacterium]